GRRWPHPASENAKKRKRRIRLRPLHPPDKEKTGPSRSLPQRLPKSLALPQVPLQPGEALLIHSTLAKHQLPDLTALTLKEPDGIAFTKKEEWTKTLFGSQHVAVVSDADFRRVMRKLPPIQTEQYYGYLVPEWSNRAVPATDSPEVRLGTKLDKMNKDRLREGKADGVVVSRAGNFVNLKQATRIMIFVGLFIAAIFSVFTASFLYFKLFNDLQQDQRHYHSLSKIGLSEKEMKRSATIQIALLFYIPLIFAALQTLVGLWGLASLFYFPTNMIMVGFAAIGAYLILYTIYFVMVRSRFLSQLKRVMV